jgi:hypothetical protein
MRTILTGFLLSFIVFAAARPASACTFIVYCDEGRQCVKSKGALYNVCLDDKDAVKKDVLVAAAGKESVLDVVKDGKSTIQMLKEYLVRKKQSR